ncbi:MAG: 50S ribosomal protein L10 [Acidimicrobiales bacterium]|jgi:large subunit ribosomal protein L10
MAGPRPEKVAVVEEVREHLGSASAAILTEYRGLKVGDLATLRRQLRSAGADYKIFKNTLVRRATADTDQAALNEYLNGPTAIVFVRDDVGAVAKVLRDFGRVHPQLIVKGGLLGTKLIDANGAGALAELPSRDALLAQLAGAIAAPMRQFAGLLQALPRSFAYGLSALIDERGGVVVIAAAAETAEPTDAAEPVTAETASVEPTDVAEATEAGVSGEKAEATEVTEAADNAEVSDATEASDAPEVSDTPEVSDATEVSDPPEASDTTEASDTPEASDTTEASGAAEATEG